MIYLGEIKSGHELLKGLISRTEAIQYYDVNTLKPMVPLIKEAGLIRYYAIVNGKIAEYLNFDEAQSWGKVHGYDFWLSSEISDDWRAYLKALDRIYGEVEMLKDLAKRMEFDQEELKAIPQIDRQTWLWEPKSMSLRDPRLRETTKLRHEQERSVSLPVYKSLQERYKQVRNKLAAIISGTEKPPATRTITKNGNHFVVTVRRKVLGEKLNMRRSFLIQAEAVQWEQEMSEELAVLAAMKQSELGTPSIQPGFI